MQTIKKNNSPGTITGPIERVNNQWPSDADVAIYYCSSKVCWSGHHGTTVWQFASLYSLSSDSNHSNSETMTTFAAIPFEEQLGWGFLLCEVIHVQHPQQDMTTWHKKCGDDTSRPGSKICICIYVRYTTLWRTAVSLLHLALVQLLFGTRAIQARTQRSAEAFFVHGCQDLNHPSSIILHLHPSKTNGKVLKSLEIHLTFRFSSAWRIHTSPVTSCSCSHYDLHLSGLSCHFSRRRS